MVYQFIFHRTGDVDILTGKHQPYEQQYRYFHTKYVKEEVTKIVSTDAIVDPWAMTWILG